LKKLLKQIDSIISPISKQEKQSIQEYEMSLYNFINDIEKLKFGETPNYNLLSQRIMTCRDIILSIQKSRKDQKENQIINLDSDNYSTNSGSK